MANAIETDWMRCRFTTLSKDGPGAIDQWMQRVPESPAPTVRYRGIDLAMAQLEARTRP